MEQERRYHGGDNDDNFEDNDATSAGQERRDKLASETDDLLDDIDDLLEENPQAFVEAFIQKGGQ